MMRAACDSSFTHPFVRVSFSPRELFLVHDFCEQRGGRRCGKEKEEEELEEEEKGEVCPVCSTRAASATASAPLNPTLLERIGERGTVPVAVRDRNMAPLQVVQTRDSLCHCGRAPYHRRIESATRYNSE